MSKIFVDQVDPKTATTLTLGTTGDTVSIPSGVTIANSGSATGFGNATNFRPNVNPLLINGDMAVAQRSTSVAAITTGAPGYYHTSDRWKTRNDTAGTWTQTQEVLTADEAHEDGFSYALKLDCTTADGSLDANDMIRLMYVAEGQDLQLLKFGSSTAEALTVSFWVKATKTGINALSMYEETSNRSCNKTYTVDTTNTWEKKVISFPGDTSGHIDNDNTASMWINFFIAAGTNYTSGTLNETWATSANANRAVGQVNNADSTSNNFHITGVQFEVGEYTSATIPPFQFESYGDNLLRCQRYFTKDGDAINYAADGAMGNFSFWEDAEALGYRQYPVMMRAAPTMDTPTVSSGYRFHYASTVDDLSTAGIISTGSAFNCYIYKNGVSGTKGGAGHASIIGTGAYVSFSAEL